MADDDFTLNIFSEPAVAHAAPSKNTAKPQHTPLVHNGRSENDRQERPSHKRTAASQALSPTPGKRAKHELPAPSDRVSGKTGAEGPQNHKQARSVPKNQDLELPAAVELQRRTPKSVHDSDKTVDFMNDKRTAKGRGTAKKQKRSNTDEQEDDIIQLGDDDMLDVMAAVQATKRLEETIAQEPAPRQGRTDSDGSDESDADDDLRAHSNTVSFMDGKSSMPAARKRRKDAAKKVARGAAGEPDKTAPKGGSSAQGVKPGMLSQQNSARSVPKANRDQVFGARDTSSFHGLGLSEALSEHLLRHNYKAPTAVQKQVIPALLSGRDVMMRAPTGTGKTVAYLTPIVHQLASQQPQLSRAEGTHALIITPTRELTLQVHDVACLLVKRFVWLVAGQLIGGENRHHEKQRLRKGVIILVATPGRLLDHLQSTASFIVDNLKWLVLDEADRLLDMGFENTVASILSILEERVDSESARQSVLVSATLHSKLSTLANKLLSRPVAVGLTVTTTQSGELALAQAANEPMVFELPKGLQQLFMDVPVKLRLSTLLGTIQLCFSRTPKCKMVVFMHTCDSVELHHILLTDTYKAVHGSDVAPCRVFKLHGDMPPADRTGNMMSFHQCESGIMLCTDVAARGLDFPAVTHIIQYDTPGEVAEYVQRVGRTARMGRRGVAILFLAPSELEYREHLQKSGVAVTQQKLFPSLAQLPKPPQLSARARGERDANRAAFQSAMDAAHLCQAKLMAAVEQNPDLKAKAADAFRSFVGAYATHPHHLRQIFAIRRLHLGHVAHSMALKEQPKKLGRSASKQARKDQKSEKMQSQRKQRFKALRDQGKEYQVAGGLL